MAKLGWRQFIQQLIAADLNEVSFLRRERVPAVQQGVNGFAGADESQDLFVNRKHGERSLRTGKHGVREERRSRTTTLNQMREPRARRASYKIMRSSVCHQGDTPRGDQVTSLENGVCGEEGPPFHLTDP